MRRGAGWSDGDVALLDEARALLDAPPHAYGHVIVDEAQDLTPMQLRMVARRARDGSLTILGDVAQATGAIPYRRWDEVLPHLPRGDEATVEELRHAYRVPREIMEVALPLLDTIAPDVAPPISYRTGADAADDPPGRARSTCSRRRSARPRDSREHDGLLAVIAPDELVARRPDRRPLGRHSTAGAPRGERARVRPRRRRRAGADRGARAGTARALRRADPADEDARSSRPRARPARLRSSSNEREAVPGRVFRLGAADPRGCRVA